VSVAWSADGTRLATAGRDSTVRVWDASSAEALVTFQLLPDGESAALEGHRVVRCSPGAWRWLGWLAPSPLTGQMTRYPAETFGPLPVGT
jgi:WD40 repeat protein